MSIVPYSEPVQLYLQTIKSFVKACSVYIVVSCITLRHLLMATLSVSGVILGNKQHNQLLQS